MTTLVERATAAFEALHGPGSAARAVVRCEVSAAGTLLVHALLEGQPRWYEQSESAWVELFAHEETALPELPPGLRAENILSWRPGRRLVALDEQDPARVFKFLRRRRGPAARLRHAFVARQVAPHVALARLDADGTGDRLVFERSLGRGLDLALDEKRFSKLARGLAALGNATPTLELVEHGPAEELGVLATWAARWTQVAGALPAGFEAARARLERGARDTGRRVVAHRDLHDGQFLVEPDRLVLLDCDLLARAEPELDLANLLEHLRLCERQGLRRASAENVRAAERTLLAGLPDLEPRVLEFYRATSALRLALVHGLRPRWRALAEPLVARALQRCEALGS